MFPMGMNNVDVISINVLGLLANLSTHVLHVEDGTNELLKFDEFHKNVDFQKFIFHNLEGMFYHFRAQGNLEGLVMTKCYSPVGINVFLNKLLHPAIDHYMMAEMYFIRVRENPKLAAIKEFKVLEQLLIKFKQVLQRLMQEVGKYGF